MATAIDRALFKVGMNIIINAEQVNIIAITIFGDLNLSVIMPHIGRVSNNNKALMDNINPI
jgi:hypothetical protein